MRLFCLSGLFCLAVALAAAAGPPWEWIAQASSTTSNLRGVSAPADGAAWASGTEGTYLRSTDGKNWKSARVAGAEKLDFRDVEAFDAATALLMSAGPGAASRIYRTADAGASWTLSLENPDAKGFFDAIAFWDQREGLCLGDPVDGAFVLFSTHDGGSSWQRIPAAGLPPALPGEGAFAASGTCLAVGPDGRAWFGSGGGGTGRVFRSEDRGRTWRTAPAAIAASTPSSGVFSLTFADKLHGVAVGGDYRIPHGPAASIARSEDGGATWTPVTLQAPLDRFFSAVVVVPGTRPPILVATGPDISAWSSDGGRSWNPSSSPEGYNALAFSGARAGWAVGPAGRIGRFPESESGSWRTGGSLFRAEPGEVKVAAIRSVARPGPALR